MTHEERWEPIEKIGSGGQGTVSLVRNKSAFHSSLTKLRASIDLLRSESEEARLKGYQDFGSVVKEFTQEPVGYLGALKVLHSPNEARNFDLAEERIKRELQAMKDLTHPNLIELLDEDTDVKWFVTKYYPRSTLTKNSSNFTGNIPKALRAIRPLVEAVAVIHDAGYVHRDIKPDNIFVSDNDQLILGDFGLVFFDDPEHTRISQTYENVGSTDWMPQWATRMRIEDVRPTFDVFTLGKTLWSMVSDTPIMRLWYYYRDEFNLERKFPEARYMRLANDLFSRCIVEDEEDCEIHNAKEFLNAIDEINKIIDRDADVVDISERHCEFCGRGKYEHKIEHFVHEFGLSRAGNRDFKIFICNNCGHMLIFTGEGNVPDPWVRE